MKKPAILIFIPQTIEKWKDTYFHLLRNPKTGVLYVGQPNQQKEKYEVVVPLLLSTEQIGERIPPAMPTAWHLNRIHKVISVLDHFSFDVEKFNTILQRDGNCSVEWEPNQCDGCLAGIPLMDGTSTHKKPNDPTDRFGIGCTAHLYD